MGKNQTQREAPSLWKITNKLSSVDSRSALSATITEGKTNSHAMERVAQQWFPSGCSANFSSMITKNQAQFSVIKIQWKRTDFPRYFLAVNLFRRSKRAVICEPRLKSDGSAICPPLRLPNFPSAFVLLPRSAANGNYVVAGYRRLVRTEMPRGLHDIHFSRSEDRTKWSGGNYWTFSGVHFHFSAPATFNSIHYIT